MHSPDDIHPNDDVVINVTLDWRVLALIVLFIAVAAVTISVAGAQDRPTLNDGAGGTGAAVPTAEHSTASTPGQSMAACALST